MKNNHSEISPSNFRRRMLCAGSLLAERYLSDERSKFAEIGTILHDRVNKYITGSCEKWGEDLTFDQVDAVINSANYFKELKLDKEIILEQHEKKYNLNFIYEGMSGTLDSLLIMRNKESNLIEVHVIDYKFGKGLLVSAKDNHQLMLYAMGVCFDEETEDLLNKEEVNFHLHIVQPFRINSVWSLSKEKLYSYISNFKKVAISCYDPKAKLTPNIEACMFCKAKSTCKALANTVPNFNIKPDRLKDSEIIKIYDNRKLITLYLNSIEEYLTERLKENSLKGYELRPKISNRKWKDNAAEYLLDKLGHNATFEVCEKIITITKAEKLLSKEEINDLTFKEEVGNEIVKIEYSIDDFI